MKCLTLLLVAQLTAGQVQPMNEEFARNTPPNTLVRLGSSRFTYTAPNRNGGVTASCFDHTGKRLITARTESGTIRVWSVPDGKLSKQFDIPLGNRAVWQMHFSPKKNALITCEECDGLRLWDITAGRLLLHLKCGYEFPLGSAVDFKLAAGGNQIVSSHFAGGLAVWNIDTSEPIRLLKGDRATEPVERPESFGALHLTPDESTILAESEMEVATEISGREANRFENDMLSGRTNEETARFSLLQKGGKSYKIEATKRLSLWDVKSGKRLHLAGRAISFIGYIDNEVAIAVAPGELQWIKPRSGEVVRRRQVKGLRTYPYYAALNADRKLLVLRTDGPVLLIDTDSGNAENLESDRGLGGPFLFSPDGSTLVGFRGEAATLWSVKERKETSPVDRHFDDIVAGSFSSNNSLVATGRDGVILWDRRTGKFLDQFLSDCHRINQVEISNDETHLLVGTHEEVKLIRRAEKNLIVTFPRASAKVARFSTDGKHFWIGDVGGNLKKISTRNGSIVASLPVASAAFNALAVNDDDSIAVSDHFDGNLRVWDLNKNILIRSIPTMRLTSNDGGYRPKVRLAVSTKQNRIAWTSPDGYSGVWNLADGERISGPLPKESKGYGYGPFDIVFDLENRALAVYTETNKDETKRTLVMKDAVTGLEVWRSPETEESPLMVSFSRDLRWMLTNGASTTALVWDLDLLLKKQSPK
jgi:WD40 repeat protein